jgi:hypothetical protein
MYHGDRMPRIFALHKGELFSLDRPLGACRRKGSRSDETSRRFRASRLSKRRCGLALLEFFWQSNSELALFAELKCEHLNSPNHPWHPDFLRDRYHGFEKRRDAVEYTA